MRTPDGCGGSGDSLPLQAAAHTASPSLLASQAGIQSAWLLPVPAKSAALLCSGTGSHSAVLQTRCDHFVLLSPSII